MITEGVILWSVWYSDPLARATPSQVADILCDVTDDSVHSVRGRRGVLDLDVRCGPRKDWRENRWIWEWDTKARGWP